MPNYLSPDARNLINSMLAVDPVRRITIPEILKHPFFITDLPRYLCPLPPPPGPILGPLSTLVSPPKAIDFEIIEGLGRIEDEVVDDLVHRMEGISKQDILNSLRRDDGIQGNAVKVAYMLLRDKRRLGHDCKWPNVPMQIRISAECKPVAEVLEQEREAELAAMDVSLPSNLANITQSLTHSPQPRNPLSPNAISPGGGGDLEENPFDSEFNDYDEDDLDDGLDFSTPQNEAENSNFAVLNSSLPDQLPEPHHLASYVSMKRWQPREKKQHRTKWHFGIRSRSPPMEVMLEIYRTLKALGMEWKEKKDLGGLGGIQAAKARRNGKVERAREYDGGGYVDLRAASAIYFIEARARVEDVVVCPFFSMPLSFVSHRASGLDEPTALHGRFYQLSR